LIVSTFKSYEAIWDTANANHVKVTMVTNFWLALGGGETQMRSTTTRDKEAQIARQ
jgi:hypothetical protein